MIDEIEIEYQQEDDDVYSEEGRMKLLDGEEISDEEEGFMKGYDSY